MKKCEMTVQSNQMIARNVYQLTLHGELAQQIRAPGQFVHVRCGEGWETLLRRPISIADWNIDDAILTLIFRATGSGTTWLAERRIGEIVDVFGPLGNGFALPASGKQTALLVGGGVGVPPLFGLGRALAKNGVKLYTYLGFASALDVFLVDQFRQLGDVSVVTDDGTYGMKARVTEAIDTSVNYDLFYACGPTPMLKALQQLFNQTSTEGYLSLEQRMGCGIGACLACVCSTTDGDQKKICSDGPVFPFKEVAL